MKRNTLFLLVVAVIVIVALVKFWRSGSGPNSLAALNPCILTGIARILQIPFAVLLAAQTSILFLN